MWPPHPSRRLLRSLLRMRTEEENAMKHGPFTRRDVLKVSAAATVFAVPDAGKFMQPAQAQVRAQAPAATAVTLALIEAAKKEGKAVWYAAMDLPGSERVARGLEAKSAGVAGR